MKRVRMKRVGRVFKSPKVCRSGPWSGYVLYLTPGDWNTLPIVIRGERGRYSGGFWHPEAARG